MWPRRFNIRYDYKFNLTLPSENPIIDGMKPLPRLLVLSMLAFQLAGCASDKLIEPEPSAPGPVPAMPRPAPVASAPEYRGPATRPFLMGFTHWPADLTDQGVAVARDYARAHGDIVAINFIGGIPWPE